MKKEFDFKEIEENITQYWQDQNIYPSLIKRNKGQERFYFLQGPPYTNGKIHLGTAWNNSLKDSILRFKRMQGYDVWDRAGWDNHGLPTEWAIMKMHGLKDDADVRAFGIEKFIDECRDFCLSNKDEMTKTLQSLGIWMNFDDPYMTLSKDWINSVWWFIKTAHDKGRLYEGLRTMTWDVPAATAVAKHELEYKEVEDTAIFVKFKVRDTENDYVVIWTTTPWTIPFNLAVMVNPELDYDKVKVTHNGEEEFWWVCKDLAEHFLGMIQHHIEIVDTKKGNELAGMSYIHPFEKDMGYAKMKKEYPNLHTVLLSKEYVDTSAGSGLVHCAPGCGPEDFEVGYRNGLPPYNTVMENGVFEKAGQFNGLIAKKNDDVFIQRMKEQGCLIHTHSYVHDYPFDQRSKEPVIFRTTKQWFLKVEDIKEQLIKENNEIDWRPKAAYNAFNSWLENIRDNSISKQRYWGTPLPIWRNIKDPEDYIVVGSSAELKELTGKDYEDLHTPTLDKVIIKKEGKTYKRVVDVIDVWVDAGVGSFACLKYPQSEENIALFPADFILEGKDQIRGWFNLLHLVSMVAFGKKAFKTCYMHGFVMDSQGRKMSKSLGNYIIPKEVTDTYGADVFRLYFIGSAQPGIDANYNPEDVEQRSRNLRVLWNVHNYLKEMKNTLGTEKKTFAYCSLEEHYILSKLHSTLRDVTKAFTEYQLNIIPGLIETFWLELSRSYLQLVRDKATNGSDEEKINVYSVLSECMEKTLQMISTITPFTAEQMWQNLGYEGSVHASHWPEVTENLIDTDLEKSFKIAQDTITAGLAAREKVQLGVRWPLASMTIETSKEVQEQLKRVLDLLRSQLNVKEIRFAQVPVKLDAKPNYRNIGKAFGEKTADVLTMLKGHMEQATQHLEKGEKEFTLEGCSFQEEMFEISILPAEGTTSVLFEMGKVMIDTTLTPELEAEGYLRELTRRVQNMRKLAGLEKKDKIILEIGGDVKGINLATLQEKVGARSIVKGGSEKVTIKERTFTLGIRS